MAKVVLIHANCTNPNASGDFTFAANMVRDLVREIRQKKLDIEVILVSSSDGISRFEKIYGKASNGKITIDNESITLCDLEQFDSVENTTIAIIEANRCKFPPSEIVKKVISPETKFLFIGNANKGDISDVFSQQIILNHIKKTQPNLYENFSNSDLIISAAGIDSKGLGLSTIPELIDLPRLTSSETDMIPKEDYGFMYLRFDSDKDLDLVKQFIELTSVHANKYILIGKDFQEKLEEKYKNDKNFPEIQYHDSVPNNVMRHMVASSGELVLSTGINSTLEAMQDGKLPYYQIVPNCKNFVESYLIVVKSIIAGNLALWSLIPKMNELANLLFANKPLTQPQMQRSHKLLANSEVTTELIKVNRKIVAQASGKLSRNILALINSPRKTKDSDQLAKVLYLLREMGDSSPLACDKALRRAAAQGRLFELKILINAMSTKELDLRDSSHLTALHWAAKNNQVDCLRALIKAGASLNMIDRIGHTPLYKAIINKNKKAEDLLRKAGAGLIFDKPLKNTRPKVFLLQNMQLLSQSKLEKLPKDILKHTTWNGHGLFSGRNAQLNKNIKNGDIQDFHKELQEIIIEAVKASKSFSIFKNKDTQDFYDQIFDYFDVDISATLAKIQNEIEEITKQNNWQVSQDMHALPANVIKIIVVCKDSKLSDQEKLRDIIFIATEAAKNNSSFFSTRSEVTANFYANIMQHVTFIDTPRNYLAVG